MTRPSVSVVTGPLAVHRVGGGDRAAPSSAYLGYVVALITIINVVNYMDRTALSVLMPAIKAELHLSDSALGLLVGLAFSLFYGLAGIPIARLADRGVRRTIIAICLAVWSLMTAVSGSAQSFWQLFAARVGVGAGEAGCLPPSQSMMSDYFPAERRPAVFAILNIGLFLGMMLGITLTGRLEAEIGWRWTFVALGLPGIVLAAVVMLTLREPPRAVFDHGKPNVLRQYSAFEAAAVLFRNPVYRLLILLNIGMGFVQQGLLQWLPSFYERVFDVELSSIALMLGMMIGAGSALGLGLGGWIASRAGIENPGRPFVVGAAGFALASVSAVGALFASSIEVSMWLVAATCALWNLPIGAHVAAIQAQVPPRLRATAPAVVIFLVSVFGFGLGPYFVGAASDALAAEYGDQTLRYAILIPVAAIPLVVAALLKLADALTLPTVPSLDGVA